MLNFTPAVSVALARVIIVFQPFRMEGAVIKHTKGKFRSYASVAQCLKQNKGWTQYDWTDPPGTQYPSRSNDEQHECVFIQKGNMVFTGNDCKIARIHQLDVLY